MSDWQVGDLAVCVDDSNPADPVRGPAIKVGRVYAVVGITPLKTWERGHIDVGLLLQGVRHYTNRSGHFFAGLFAKIRPDEHEACEPEFITLLKRSKVAA